MAPARVSPEPLTYDAVVLSGGQGRRLGGIAKGEVRVGSATLLEHALRAAAGAARTVVVGPASPHHPTRWTTREQPAGGGPVAGLAAGIERLHQDAAPWVLILACDTPRAHEAVPLLEEAAAAGAAHDGAWMVDQEGRAQPLMALYRVTALRGALASLGNLHGAPMRALTEHLAITPVPDLTGATQDADTWDAVARLRDETR